MYEDIAKKKLGINFPIEQEEFDNIYENMFEPILEISYPLIEYFGEGDRFNVKLKSPYREALRKQKFRRAKIPKQLNKNISELEKIARSMINLSIWFDIHFELFGDNAINLYETRGNVNSLMTQISSARDKFQDNTNYFSLMSAYDYVRLCAQDRSIQVNERFDLLSRASSSIFSCMKNHKKLVQTDPARFRKKACLYALGSLTEYFSLSEDEMEIQRPRVEKIQESLIDVFTSKNGLELEYAFSLEGISLAIENSELSISDNGENIRRLLDTPDILLFNSEGITI